MNTIVGIDPGITAGIAVLDMKGNLLFLKSSKKYGLKSAIKKLASCGKPLIIATDVKKPPEFVQLVASKFDAVLTAPEADLKRADKERLVSHLNVKFNNHHERDALAAAVYAYKQYEPLISKVLKKAKDVFEPLIRDLILKRTKNINTGIKKYK